jgi:threonine dehydratase
VLVSDQAMRDAARWLWFEAGIAVELSAAAAIAALMTGAVTAGAGERVCALICGAGTDGMA